MSRRRNNKYSVELKLQAVQDYLRGGRSYETLKEKIQIKKFNAVEKLGYVV